MKYKLVAAVTAAVFSLTAPVMAQTAAIGTLETGSVFHTMGSVISKVARDTNTMGVVVQPNGGTFAMLTATSQGLAEFAIDDVNDAIAAIQGKDEHKGQALQNLRVALTITPLPIGLIVPADSGIESAQELKGKRIPSGWSAFPLANSHIAAVLAASDMTMDDVKAVPTTGLLRAADDFVAGRLDATYFAIGAPKVAEMNAALDGVRFLPVPDTAETLEKVQSIRPAFYVRTVPPLPHLAGLEKPTPLVTWDAVLLTSSDVSDDTVYKLVKTMVENRDALVAAFPGFNGFRPQTAAKPHPVIQYHPGAERYFQEAGLWPSASGN